MRAKPSDKKASTPAAPAAAVPQTPARSSARAGTTPSREPAAERQEHGQAVTRSHAGASDGGNGSPDRRPGSVDRGSSVDLDPQRRLEQMQHSGLLFEIGWEVCWQLGGIYTVLRTKAKSMLERWGERYCLVGPYNPATAATEFDETRPDGVWRDLIDRAQRRGVVAHHGRWLVPGRPRTILVDHRARFGRLHEDKYLLWTDHGISTTADDGEVNEVVSFGFAVAELLAAAAEAGEPNHRAILAHLHEWMAGVAVPRLAHMRAKVQTVFTTHATLLGRYLASDDPKFYDHLPFYNAEAEADKYTIGPRHRIEKAAAHACHVFTTVSDVTAREAEHLLGRAPEIVLPNGLDIARFEAPHEFHHLHQQHKQEIHNFVMGHFFPSAPFDLDRSLYLFTSGRYEYKNKGIDLFIEALYRLNQRLRWARDKDGESVPTFVAFIITRAAIRSVNVETLTNQAQIDELRRYCEQLKEQIGQRIFKAAAEGHMVGRGDLIDEEAEIRLKRAINAARVKRFPSVVTHDLADDHNDPILRHLRHRNLINDPADPVKVVFHPQFVSATSPLLSLEYDQFVRGCHMGLFPSYYEPWGYTPMECIASGVPTVTTDLAGFGSYVRTMPDVDVQLPAYIPHVPGVLVLDRGRQGFDASTQQLCDHAYAFSRLTRRQRIEMRNRVERLASRFGWDSLAAHYHEAHDLALSYLAGVKPIRGKVEVVEV